MSILDKEEPAPIPKPLPATEDEFRVFYRDNHPVSFHDGLPNTNSKENGMHKTSGSQLGIESLLAFRVVPMFDQIPSEVIPGYDELDDFRKNKSRHREDMLKQLTAATALDLGLVALARPSSDESIRYRQHLTVLEQAQEAPLSDRDTSAMATTIVPRFMSTFINNPFLTVFTSIRDLRSRRLAEKFESIYDGLTDNKSNEADEDKAERGSEELLHRLMEVILIYFSQHTNGDDWFRSTPASCSLETDLPWDDTRDYPNSTELHVPTTIRLTAQDDGYLYLGRAGKTSGSHRFSMIPVVRYEAKRLDPKSWKKGNDDKVKAKKAKTQAELKKVDKMMHPADLEITAQEVAEMLTGIFTNAAHLVECNKNAKAREQMRDQIIFQMNVSEKKARDHNTKQSRVLQDGLRKADSISVASEVKNVAAQGSLRHSAFEMPISTEQRKQDKISLPKSLTKIDSELDVETILESMRNRVQSAEPKVSSKISHHPEQEAFNIRIRHTYLSICRVWTSGQYLDAIKAKPWLEKSDGTIEYKRTKEFNLLHSDERREAGKAIWALLFYLHYGSPKIGRLQARSQESLRLYRYAERTIEIVFPMKREPPRGIDGNTTWCFAKSVVQGLTATIPLAAFKTLAKPDPLEESVLSSFLQAAASLIDQTQDAVNMSELLRKISPTLYTENDIEEIQQDPCEFLNTLLNKLFKESDRIKSLFAFKQTYTIKCGKCGETESRTEDCTQLKLRVPANIESVNIQEMMQSHYTDYYERWNCPNKCKSSPSKTTSFGSFPQLLAVYLDRGWEKPRAKVLTPVALFTEELWGPGPTFETAPGNKTEYYLDAVICHSGEDVKSGRDYAYVCNPDEQEWYLCDDISVKKIPSKDMHKEFKAKSVTAADGVQTHWKESERGSPCLLFFSQTLQDKNSSKMLIEK